MVQSELQHLSVAELVELVVELRHANEQLRADSTQMSNLSNEVRAILEPGASDEPALELLTMSQSLAADHTFADLAELVASRSKTVFGMDHGLLFLAGEQGLEVVAPPAGLHDAESAGIMQPATMLARQAWEEQTIITAVAATAPSADRDATLIASPLGRYGQPLGVLVLARGGGEHTLDRSAWTYLTIFTGLIAVACDNMRRVARLESQTSMLESLVTKRTRQLQSSRDVLRIVFDHVPDGMLLLDADGTVLAANQALCEQVLNTHPRELVGRPYDALWQILEAAHGPAEVQGEETARVVRYVDGEGGEQSYEVRRHLIAGQGGDVEHTLEIWYKQEPYSREQVGG